MNRSNRFALAALVTLGTAGCAPTVAVTTPEPIEININLKHDVRIALDQEVQGMLNGEQQAAQGVGGRGLDEDLANVWADARDVDLAKENGSIGERYNGYLGLVKSPNPGAQTLVDRVNLSRKAHYEKLAAKNAVKLAEVEKVAGANRLDDAEPGQWIFPPKGGKWVRKAEAQEVEVVEE